MEEINRCPSGARHSMERCFVKLLEYASMFPSCSGKKPWSGEILCEFQVLFARSTHWNKSHKPVKSLNKEECTPGLCTKSSHRTSSTAASSASILFVPGIQNKLLCSRCAVGFWASIGKLRLFQSEQNVETPFPHTNGRRSFKLQLSNPQVKIVMLDEWPCFVQLNFFFVFGNRLSNAEEVREDNHGVYHGRTQQADRNDIQHRRWDCDGSTPSRTSANWGGCRPHNI